ncbi:PIN domain-containing protein [Algoriphagus confluentis]|uniref:PIN domain nuclease n=1 Tax=Algoriphagus confluentis TaxID=1697556 RepID=A0ABQ6PR79_9BACT|nr:PIN domain nuclease [Algoriphagus confluentis]
MERLFIDTNIVIDLLARREPFFREAQDLFTLGDQKKVQLLISALTFANAYYSISKHHKEVEARRHLANFKVLVTILPIDNKIIDLSLASEFADFEDGLQYFTAIENSSDLIITRNKKDFRDSQIPVLSAGEYLRK